MNGEGAYLRCGAARGDGALADARSSGSYWASP
jgi:hypothetical protein